MIFIYTIAQSIRERRVRVAVSGGDSLMRKGNWVQVSIKGHGALWVNKDPSSMKKPCKGHAEERVACYKRRPESKPERRKVACWQPISVIEAAPATM